MKGPIDERAPQVDDWLESSPSLDAHRDDLDVAVEERAELARVLVGVTWPATASKLAVAAAGNDADADLLARIAALPPRRRFPAVGAVWTALGGVDVDEVAQAPPAPVAPVPEPKPTPALEAVPTAAAPPPHRFGFAFAPVFLPFALPLGVTPKTAWVDVDDERLEVRFGLWVLRTDLDNIAGAEITGPYSLLKTIGPAHLSFADRGITFATNHREGVCIRFREPVGLLKHPGVTVTVADPGALMAALVS